MSTELLIVAGEASSSLYAQRLIEHFKENNLNIHCFGIGSRSMEELGFERLGKSEEMAVVGIQEVIAHWDVISKSFHSLVDAARTRKPKAALLLDYPDFNLRLAKKLKALGIPVIYYISPQVWAWRQSRVHKIKKLVDKMLVLFPFEKDFYEQHGVSVEFVGHPILDELEDKYFDPNYKQLHRTQFGIQEEEIVLGLMPGSRNSELKYHLETQLKTAELLCKKHKQVKPLLLVAPTFDKDALQDLLPRVDFNLQLVQQDPFEMIHLTDMVLVASGTATLFVGLLEKPMCVMYKMNALTATLAKLLVRSTKHFGMINLVLGERAVPEFFQSEASPKNLAAEFSKLIEDPEAYHQVVAKLAEAKVRLGETGATKRVARCVLSFLED